MAAELREQPEEPVHPEGAEEPEERKAWQQLEAEPTGPEGRP